jgi:hypothetical protein
MAVLELYRKSIHLQSGLPVISEMIWLFLERIELSPVQIPVDGEQFSV